MTPHSRGLHRAGLLQSLGPPQQKCTATTHALGLLVPVMGCAASAAAADKGNTCDPSSRSDLEMSSLGCWSLMRVQGSELRQGTALWHLQLQLPERA